MRITLRLIFSLVVAASAVVYVSAWLQASQEHTRLALELESKANILAETLQDLARSYVVSGREQDLDELVEDFADEENIAGVAVYGPDGVPLARTQALGERFALLPEIQKTGEASQRGRDALIDLDDHLWHVQLLPVDAKEQPGTLLAVIQDANHMRDYSERFWRDTFGRLLVHVLLICLITLLILRWSLIRPLSRTVEWMRRLRTGDLSDATPPPKGGIFGPLVREASRMAKSLEAAKASAEAEARLRHAKASQWTPERLKAHVTSVLDGRRLVVVANREPYMHVRQGRQVQCIMPASGLVTAVEPILRSCGGTWIAHGSGDADRENADAQGRLRVPPETPLYNLKRVWLTPEEEAGYYYGFSNEGLWPLCHIAHTRPSFREEDWAYYQSVNAKFAQATLEEIEGLENPCILIQDYHFALLPAMIKAARPDARIALFWHIPWPNPEAFGICPWARELLTGMLGADLLGFHIQYHCNNFLETVDRMLESRIDWAQFAVTRAGQTTAVKPFPISIAWDSTTEQAPVDPAAVVAARDQVHKAIGMNVEFLGVGVDRIDYTKGIAERFRAIELFLQNYPEYQGRFTFVQIGAPSRELIQRYHDLASELDAEAERINKRFQTRNWKPIVYLKKYHSHKEIRPFYQTANICLVTSLHDGMNLVAKEFVAARTDNRGVLILSRFAGASVELQDALLVNPYDIGSVAEAIACGLRMPDAEQQMRTSRMRQILQANSVYRWAAHLIGDLVAMRPVPAAPAVADGVESSVG